MRTASMRLKGDGLGQVMTPDSIADLMASLATSPKDGRVLEPGCGEGAFLSALRRAGFTSVDALDVDPRMVEACQRAGHAAVVANFLEWSPRAPQYRLVIGNPPYVRRKDMTPETRRQLDALGADVINGLSDLLYAFILRGVQLLAPGGELIFITPFYWLQSKHAGSLRRWMLRHGHLSHVIDLGENHVFPDVNVHAVIWRFVKASPGAPTRVIRIPSQRLGLAEVERIVTRRLQAGEENGGVLDFVLHVPASGREIRLEPERISAALDGIAGACTGDFAVRVRDRTGAHREARIQDVEPAGEDDRKPVRLDDHAYVWRARTLDAEPPPRRTIVLQDLFDMGPGMVSGLDAAFRLKDDETPAYEAHAARLLIRVVKGPDIAPGPIRRTTTYLRADDLTEDDLQRAYPLAYERLAAFRPQLEKRFGYGVAWHHWSFPRNERLFHENPGFKVFVPSKDRSARPRFGFTTQPVFGTQDTTVLIPRAHTRSLREDPLFFVAYLNSFVVDLWTQWRGIHRGAVRQYSNESLGRIPVPLIDWEDAHQAALHAKLLAGLPRDAPWSSDTLRHVDACFGELFGVEPSSFAEADFPLRYELPDEDEVTTRTAR